MIHGGFGVARGPVVYHVDKVTEEVVPKGLLSTPRRGRVGWSFFWFPKILRRVDDSGGVIG